MRIREYVTVDRKPFSPEEVKQLTKYESLPEHIKEEIEGLMKINGEEYFNFEEGGEGFFAELLDGDIQFYLMEWRGRRFFIDTQGYRYARYVGEIQ